MDTREHPPRGAAGGAAPATADVTRDRDGTLVVRLAPGPNTVSTTVGWMQQWSSLGQFFGPPLVAAVAGTLGGWQWTWVVTASCSLAGLLMATQITKALARNLEGK